MGFFALGSPYLGFAPKFPVQSDRSTGSSRNFRKSKIPLLSPRPSGTTPDETNMVGAKDLGFFALGSPYLGFAPKFPVQSDRSTESSRNFRKSKIPLLSPRPSGTTPDETNMVGARDLRFFALGSPYLGFAPKFPVQSDRSTGSSRNFRKSNFPPAFPRGFSGTTPGEINMDSS